MKIKTISLCIFYFIFLFVNSIFATQISIKDRQLYVNGLPFVMKGVDYDPCPVGQTPPAMGGPYIWPFDNANIAMDYPFISAMGANCIRLYTPLTNDSVYAACKPVLDAAYQKGLYVIVELPVAYNKNFQTDQTARTQLYNSAQVMVNLWKSHPAILMWCIGHEINLHTSSLVGWYSNLNIVAGKIHQWEAPYWHPVTYADGIGGTNDFAPTGRIGNSFTNAADAQMNNLDVWGIDLYQGAGFQPTLFSHYAQASSKPLWIAETGCDDWDTLHMVEAQTDQANYISAQWQQINNNLSANSKGPCVGVTFFEWSDGWWKGDSVANNPGTIGQGGVGGVGVHDKSGDWPDASYGFDAGAPGGYNMNEEWWGLVSIFPGTYERGLRQSYYTLQKFWVTGTLNPQVITLDNNNLFSLFRQTSVNIPNPIHLNQSSDTSIWVYLNFHSQLYIKIYDYTGKLIRELTNIIDNPGNVFRIDWDGKDTNNKTVSTGVYICKIQAQYSIGATAQQEVQVIKIAVVK